MKINNVKSKNIARMIFSRSNSRSSGGEIASLHYITRP
jgi:hypothetical protein